MKIVIEVELGNEAMQLWEDVLEAIPRSTRASLNPLAEGESGRIRDLNGNTVGGWKVVDGNVEKKGGPFG